MTDKDSKIYPNLPPLREDRGETLRRGVIESNPNEFRLKELEDKRKDLFHDIERYDYKLKKAKRIFNSLYCTGFICNAASGLTATGGLISLTVPPAIIAGIPFAVVAVSSGGISFLANVFMKKIFHKIKKYEK